MAFTVSNNSPSAGYIAWSGLHIQFAGAAYAITDGNTNKVYAWWTPSVPNNLVVSDTFPTLTANDCLVFLNKSGIATVVPTSTILDGDLIVPGTVLAAHLAANSVTADKIAAGSVTAGALAAGSVTANAVAAAAIGAEKIAAGAITADKLFVTDTTNMTSYDPDLYPAGIATEAVSGVNYFKRGSTTSIYTVMDFAIAKLCTFSVGDQFKFRFYGFKEASVVTLRAMVRYYYTDGTNQTCGYADFSVTETPGYTETVVTITGALDVNKTLSYVRLYVATSVPSIGYWYLRNLSLTRLTNGALIVDGTVTATKIGANQVTTDHLAALAVTAGKVDIADLFAAAATINAIRTMTVASVEDGSEFSLSKNGIYAETPAFAVNVSGTNGDMTLDETGLAVKNVESPSVQSRYTGPSILYVNKTATDAQVEAGNYFRAIGDALSAMGDRAMSSDMTINVTQGTYYEGVVAVKNITGGRYFKISFNNAVVVGAFEFYHCNVVFNVNGLKLTQYSVTNHGLRFSGCLNVSLSGNVFTALRGATASYAAVLCDRGTSLDAYDNEFYGTWRALMVWSAGLAVSRTNKGDALLSVSAGLMIAEGSQPCDSTTFGYARGTGGSLIQSGPVTVDQGGATAPEPETATATFPATTSHTVYGSTLWPGSWKTETTEVWQGYTASSQYQAAEFWFSGLSALAGKTIRSAKLRIRRVPGIGYGDTVKLVGYYGDRAYNSAGSPSNRVSMGTLGNIGSGYELVDFTIPTAAVSYLASAPTGRCIALNPGDTAVVSGKTYSRNYAKFSGVGSGYVPELVVTYDN